MSRLEIIRAWKDEAYRLTLSEAERALLPDNPAEFIKLIDQLALRSGALATPVVDERCPRNDRWATVSYLERFSLACMVVVMDN